MPDVFDSHKLKKIKPPEDRAQESSPKHIPEKNKFEKIFKTPDEADRHGLPGHTHNSLTAYSYYPDYVNFINEDPEEKVVLLLRKHPITNLGWIGVAFLMVIAPSFVSVLSPVEMLPGGFQIILLLVWYLITMAFVLEEFLSWFFHVNLITDERIVEVDFVNLIYREITDADISQIQDVTVEVGGAPRTFFGYGNILIQTAAEVPKIEFEAIPKPDTVARLLRELRVEEEVERMEGRIR